jgi:ATP-binding cassette subfamily F protein 3
VLLDALEDFGGTLVFVSHDRYFVDRLANKVIVVGHGTIETYPGTYEQFLWSRLERAKDPPKPAPPSSPRPEARNGPPAGPNRSQPPARPSHQQKKQDDAEARRLRRDQQAHERRVSQVEALIAEREQAIKTLETAMGSEGFYNDRAAAESTLSRHQALMWEVGDLMRQWESLQSSNLSK